MKTTEFRTVMINGTKVKVPYYEPRPITEERRKECVRLVNEYRAIIRENERSRAKAKVALVEETSNKLIAIYRELRHAGIVNWMGNQ